MYNLTINNFLGAVKLIDPRLIEQSMATEAVNCELEAGTIAPIKGLSLTRSLAGTTAQRPTLAANASSIGAILGSNVFTWGERVAGTYMKTQNFNQTGD